jgi:threonine dehydrogenase-like Zn-dependent dehydrogenase
MRALVMGADGVRLLERDEPRAPPGEAVLEVRRAGICATDLEIARGYMGFSGVLGHEVLGTVIEGPSDWLGARVVSEINCSCHRCPSCAAGAPTHCPTRTVLGILGRDGALAERVAVPVANLHRVPPEVSDDAAVFVEPLAAAMHAFDEVTPRPGDRVLVIGDGKLGLLIGLVLARRGDLKEARVLGRHPAKLAILSRAGLSVSLASEVLSSGYDVVVEATGQPAGLARGLELIRPRGTLILKSTYAGGSALDLAPIVIHEIRVLGSRCGAFPPAVEALARGWVDPRPLISDRFELRDAERAFVRAGEPGVLKVLLAR